MAVVAIAIVVVAALSVHWDTPYRVVSKAAKPIEGRIHFGKDSDTSPVTNARPLKASAQLQQQRAAAKNTNP
jgi:hypothetical protein